MLQGVETGNHGGDEMLPLKLSGAEITPDLQLGKGFLGFSD
jgi:hypothetical protein